MTDAGVTGVAATFAAPCPAGHADARWTTRLRDVPGAADGYLAGQVPAYLVECEACDRASRPAG